MKGAHLNFAMGATLHKYVTGSSRCHFIRPAKLFCQ